MILPKRWWLLRRSDSADKKYTGPWKTELPLSQKPEHCFVMKTILAWNLQEKMKQSKNSNNNRTNKQQTNKKHRITSCAIYQSLCQQNCWRMIGDPVFHTGKPTHSLYKNTGLTCDAVKTELPAPQLQRKATPNFPHQAPSILTTSLIFFSVPVFSTEWLFWNHMVDCELLSLFNSSLQHPCATLKAYPKE